MYNKEWERIEALKLATWPGPAQVREGLAGHGLGYPGHPVRLRNPDPWPGLARSYSPYNKYFWILEISILGF